MNPMSKRNIPLAGTCLERGGRCTNGCAPMHNEGLITGISVNRINKQTKDQTFNQFHSQEKTPNKRGKSANQSVVAKKAKMKFTSAHIW